MNAYSKNKWLMHKGNKNSGRYPRGSGENPYQHEKRPSELSDDELTKKVKRLTSEKTYDKLIREKYQETPQRNNVQDAKKVFDESQNLVRNMQRANDDAIKDYQRSHPTPRLNLSGMTDQQLRDAINRGNLERQYNELFIKKAPEVPKGHKYVSDILETAGGLLAIGGSALGIALAIQQLRNGSSAPKQ